MFFLIFKIFIFICISLIKHTKYYTLYRVYTLKVIIFNFWTIWIKCILFQTYVSKNKT